MSTLGKQRRSIERQLRAQTGRRFKSGHTTHAPRRFRDEPQIVGAIALGAFEK